MRCEETGFYHSSLEGGEIKGYVANNDEQIEELVDGVDMTIDWPDVLIERFENTLYELHEPVGFIMTIEVDESARGQGIGAKMLDDYMRGISQNTAVDVLFARVDNEQETGIDLQSFYQSRGFEPVHKCDGSLLMVNKGKRELFLSALLPHRTMERENEKEGLEL